MGVLNDISTRYYCLILFLFSQLIFFGNTAMKLSVVLSCVVAVIATCLTSGADAQISPAVIGYYFCLGLRGFINLNCFNVPLVCDIAEIAFKDLCDNDLKFKITEP